MDDYLFFYLLFYRRSNINSGYTGMMGSGEWGKGELLTLTLSFPSNRKRYKKQEGFSYLGENEEAIDRISFRN